MMNARAVCRAALKSAAGSLHARVPAVAGPQSACFARQVLSTTPSSVSPMLALRTSNAVRTLSSTAASRVKEAPLMLNQLAPAPGSTHTSKRLGRGIGSGKGKTCGRGHKGQKARRGTGKPYVGHEGGQTPLYRRLPKRGFTNPFRRVFTPLNLNRLQDAINDGRLDASKVITMKDIYDCHLLGRTIKGDGVKLLAKGDEAFSSKIEIEVSRVSAKAREAIEKAGGKVTPVYYTKLNLRALLKPEKYDIIPRRAFPPPKQQRFYPEHQEHVQLEQARNSQ